MAETPREREIRAKLEPAIQKFVQVLDKMGLQVSALVFDPEGDFLMRCGNAPAEGRELVRLHYWLSLICASLEAAGYFQRLDGESGPQPPDPQESADRLVLALLQMPKEMVPERVLQLVDAYVNSRGS
jgi:hypothetical protein